MPAYEEPPVLPGGSFFMWSFLNPADDLAGKHHRQQRPGDSAKGDIAEGKQQDGKIAGQVDPLDGDAEAVAQAHGQGIVTAGGTAGPDAQARADADEQGSHQGGRQGIVCNFRPQGRKLLADTVAQGKAQGRQEGVADKGFAEGPPSQQIAGGI